MRAAVLSILCASAAACGGSSASPAGPGASAPATVVSMVGDADGFGLGIPDGGTRAGALGSFDARQSGDPSFTDVMDRHPSDQYSHEFAWSGSVSAATLTFMTLAVKDGDTQIPGDDTDIRLFVEGVEVPGAFDTVDQFFFQGSEPMARAGRVSIQLPTAVLPQLADGRATVRVETHQLGTTPAMSLWAIDFSELTVTR